MSPIQVGTAYVDIRPDLKPFGRELRTGISRDVARAGDETARSLKTSFAGAARGAAAAFGAAFAAVRIKEFFGDAIGLASDLHEVASKTAAVFGGATSGLERWAEGAADALGLSRRAALDAASSYGSLFTQLGITETRAAHMSQKLVQAGVDLRSFAGGDIGDVLDAINASFRGEFDSLQRWVPLISAAQIQQRALVETGKKNAASLTQQEKAAATYSFILDHLGSASGDFERTSDSLANRQQQLNAQWENAQAELGKGLMPLMVSFAGVLNDTVLPALQTLFLGTGADATGWAATLRDAIGDTAGFILGAMAEIARGVANLIGGIDALTPGRFGEDIAADLRVGADAIDESRLKIHASTAELLSWRNANGHAEVAAKALAPSVTGVADAMEESTAALKDNADAAQDAAAAQRGLLAAQRDVRAAERDLADVRRERDLAAANVARFGSDTAREELADAEDAVADAEDRVADAKDRVADANDRVNDLGDKTVAGTPRFVGAVDNRTSAVKALNDQLGTTAERVRILDEVVGPAGTAAAAAVEASGGFAMRPGETPDQYLERIAGAGWPVPGTSPLAGTAAADAVQQSGGFAMQPGETPAQYLERISGAGWPTAAAQRSLPPVPTSVKNVTINQTFNEKMDPGLVGKAIAWQI